MENRFQILLSVISNPHVESGNTDTRSASHVIADYLRKRRKDLLLSGEQILLERMFFSPAVRKCLCRPGRTVSARIDNGTIFQNAGKYKHCQIDLFLPAETLQRPCDLLRIGPCLLCRRN